MYYFVDAIDGNTMYLIGAGMQERILKTLRQVPLVKQISPGNAAWTTVKR